MRALTFNIASEVQLSDLKRVLPILVASRLFLSALNSPEVFKVHCIVQVVLVWCYLRDGGWRFDNFSSLPALFESCVPASSPSTMSFE